MKVLLISANKERNQTPVMPLGLACVAEAVKNAGHSIQIADLMYASDISQSLVECILNFEPHCIGVSIRNIDDQNSQNSRFLLRDAKDIVNICREYSHAPIVLGGAGYSIYPRSALTFLNSDFGIQGEGEIAFPLLLNALQNNEDTSAIPGLFSKEKPSASPMKWCDSIDELTLPEPDILSELSDNAKDRWITVQSRRGCPLHCIYCSTPAIEGNILRMRSPKSFAKWLESWTQKGFTNFYMADNTFNIPSDYAKELCREIIGLDLDIKWKCIIYPKGIDKELAGLMSAAGCKQVSLGYESGSQRILRVLKKEYSIEEVRRTSQILAENRIERVGFLMLGTPEETKESVEESLIFSESLNLDMLKITIGIRIYPNTDLSRIAVNEGMISAECNLLTPHFYIANGLENWLLTRVKDWQITHQNVVI